MRIWMMRLGVIFLGGTLLAAVSGCAHDPNHGISIEQARAAARRIHPPPPPGVKLRPGAGG